jgi:hypothetical protein
MSGFEAGSTMQPSWRVASLCAGGECIEVAGCSDAIILRDSTQPHGVVLNCSAEKWRSFVATIKAEDFNARRV